MNHTSHINHINVVHVKCTPSHGGGKCGLCAPQKYIWKGVAPVHVLFGGSHESKYDHKRAGKAYLPFIHLPFTTPALNHHGEPLSCLVIPCHVMSWLL